ncbi:pirin family protein [Sedimentitalea sp. HM32M-2]|uniref:pirin family protein n=1 Tax=Sedimentitalea sp. HM32M-2 TaxID=3351566 RepID=UPI00363D9878
MLQDIIFHPADTRDFKDFGFMQAHLSFKPHLPEGRKRFGPLITIDDGTQAPGSQGFGLHPHRDVEVITFLVSGEVKHIDPNVPAHSGTAAAKGVQVITAGRGIVHNEVNNSPTAPMRALKIWLAPRATGLAPHYSKMALDAADYTNRLRPILSPQGDEGTLVAQQDVRLCYGQFNRNDTLAYPATGPVRGLYLFMVEGTGTAAGHALAKGDGLGLTNAGELAIHTEPDAEFLIFDLPETSIH